MLMNKKELYEQPNVSVFTVQTEGVICQSLQYGLNGQAGGDFDFNNLGDF